MSSELQYIRDYYRVPAAIGGRVKYTGGKGTRYGTITGVRNHYLLVRLDGNTYPHVFHPTWELHYLPARAGVLSHE